MIEIRQAKSEADRLGAARLQYEVLYLGNRWLIPGVDPDERTVPLSSTGTLLIAVDDDRVVGTMTLEFYGAGDAPPTVDAKYGLGGYFEEDPALRVAVISKLAVHKEFRSRRLGPMKMTVAQLLFVPGFQLVVEHRSVLAFWDATPQVVPYYRSLGARPCGPNTYGGGLGVNTPMVLALSDLERYEALGSPLLPMARALGLEHDEHGRRLIEEVAPRADLGPAAASVPDSAVRRIEESRPLLAMPAHWLELLAPAVEVLTLEPGQVLLHPDQPNEDLFLVRLGILELVDPLTDQVFAQLIAGEPVGEESWRRRIPPKEIVRASPRPGERVEVYRVHGPTLWELLTADASLGAAQGFWQALIDVLAERQGRASPYVTHPDTTWTRRTGRE